jgi:predicted HAD superfamily Cof-like phosphohydrolase
MIEQINELAADGQQQFQELAVDLAEFNNKANQYIEIIEHQRDELLDMVEQFELKHSVTLGSEFKVFACTDWSDVKKIDLSKISESLDQNLKRVEDQTLQIEVQKEASIKAILLCFEEQLKSLRLICPS